MKTCLLAVKIFATSLINSNVASLQVMMASVLTAESLKFSHSRLYVLLSLCLSLCLTHGYFPKFLMETTIVPIIVKNKCGNLSNNNNYRPIAIATITSKVLESLILVKCEEFLYIFDNQLI